MLELLHLPQTHKTNTACAEGCLSLGFGLWNKMFHYEDDGFSHLTETN